MALVSEQLELLPELLRYTEVKDGRGRRGRGGEGRGEGGEGRGGEERGRGERYSEDHVCGSPSKMVIAHPSLSLRGLVLRVL